MKSGSSRLRAMSFGEWYLLAIFGGTAAWVLVLGFGLAFAPDC